MTVSMRIFSALAMALLVSSATLAAESTITKVDSRFSAAGAGGVNPIGGLQLTKFDAERASLFQIFEINWLAEAAGSYTLILDCRGPGVNGTETFRSDVRASKAGAKSTTIRVAATDPSVAPATEWRLRLVSKNLVLAERKSENWR